MDDKEAVKDAMAPCSAVLSLLGPSITQKDIHPSLYADYYKRTVFPAMRELNIRRIIAMGTISLSRPDDRWTILQPMVRGLMRLFAGNLFKNMLNLEHAFEEDGRGLDWTVFRIAAIPGESDDESWRRDRESCQVYSGCVGGKGWTTSIPRAALARWIVDNVAAEEWYAKIPAVSILAS